ncbi:MAG: glycosyltransferase family 4 protein [Anaerolineae bacterium]|nr:glycosyltransferase family 4 protein [Anaerolineae bacterium]
MSNIGIVTTWFDRGASYVSHAYYEALKEKNNVFIYARGNEKRIKLRDEWKQEFVTFGKQIHIGVPTYIVWSDFKNWIIQNNIDTVLFNEQHSWDVIIRCQSLKIKVGAYVDYYTPETVPFFDLYDFLICNTKRHFSVFENHPQAVYLPWGTDCQVFKPEKKNNDLLIFFHSCGMSPYRKGTDILIKAFTQIKGACKLIIHTQIKFENPEIISIVENDKRIEIIEQTVSPPGLFHLGDIYVYPTRLEGIGLTIIEALASGLPVITTDNGPMNEFVKHGQNGFLIPVEKFQKRADNYYWPESVCDIDLLFQAMQSLVNYPEQIQSFKNNARQSAETYYNWNRNSIKLTEEIFKTKKMKINKNTLTKCAVYEYTSYPKFIIAAIKRKILPSKH